MPTVEDVLAEARGVYLNDPGGNKYTDATMLPLVRSAYGFLQTKLQGNGLQIVSEEATKTFALNSDGKTANEWFPLPVDLLVPIKMQERQSGTTDEYKDMRLYYNIPKETPGPYFEAWAWRADRIFLKESTTVREAKLFYRRSFPVLAAVDSQLYGKAEQFLAAKIAALALMFIDQSPQLAAPSNEIAENEIEELINLAVKAKQSIPVRPRPYLPFRLR